MRIASGVPGLDWKKVLADRDDAAVTQQLGEANTAFSRYGGRDAHSCSGPRDQDLKKVTPSYTELPPAIDAELKAAGATRERRPAARTACGSRALVLALVGIGIAAYLTYVHYAGTSPSARSPTAARRCRPRSGPSSPACRSRCSACSATSGSWARCSSAASSARLAAAAMSLVGFGFSAYLTYREIFTIEAICIWCVASAIVLTLLTVVTTAPPARPAARPPRTDSGPRDGYVGCYPT